MSIAPILKFGRAIGLENYSQLKNFGRFLTSGKAGKATLRLETTPNLVEKLAADADAFISQNIPAVCEKMMPNCAEAYNQAKTLLPTLYKDGNKSILDIVFKRFGVKSGIIDAKTVTRDANGKAIARGKIKALLNETGASVKAKAKVNENPLSVSYDITALKGKSVDADKIMEAIKMKLADGVASIRLPKINAGGVIAKGKLTMDEKFADAFIKRGGGNSFAEIKALHDAAKKSLS